jgi:hypothetical protein
MRYLKPANVRITCKPNCQITITTDNASGVIAKNVISALKNLCGLEVYSSSETSFLVAHSQFGITTQPQLANLAHELGSWFARYELSVNVFTIEDPEPTPGSEVEAAGGIMLLEQEKG